MSDAPDQSEDPLVEFPGYLLRRASVAALNEIKHELSGFGLRHAEFAMLRLIWVHPGISQSKAGRVLDIQRPNMATLVAKLEKRGLIAREPIDKRSQAIRLTTAGSDLVNKAYVAVEACEKALIKRVPAELRDAVRPILLAIWQGTADACARNE